MNHILVALRGAAAHAQGVCAAARAAAAAAAAAAAPPRAAAAARGPVRLPGWCNYDHRPYFARLPTVHLKSSVELQNSARRVDTYHLPPPPENSRNPWILAALRAAGDHPPPKIRPAAARIHTYPPSCGF
jgi:hypothetical protein